MIEVSCRNVIDGINFLFEELATEMVTLPTITRKDYWLVCLVLPFLGVFLSYPFRLSLQINRARPGAFGHAEADQMPSLSSGKDLE
jgi:hypothetical protein